MTLLTTAESHILIFSAVIAGLVTTLIGMRQLRRKINGHIEKDK